MGFHYEVVGWQRPFVTAKGRPPKRDALTPTARVRKRRKHRRPVRHLPASHL